MKKTVFINIFILALLFVAPAYAGAALNGSTDETSVFSTIMERIRETEWAGVSNVAALDAEAAAQFATLSANGSWSDIPYTSQAQTNWEPIAHLDRLKKMVLAYTLNTSAHYGNANLYTAISKAFEYWHTADPRSTNWFMQQIGCPQRVGVMLVLMRSGAQQLASDLENKLLARMESIGGRPDQSGSQGTGANKIDIATHWVYRGCLKENASVLSFGVEQVYYPVFTTTGEGLQSDYAYFQHGQQFFNGGYGISFVNGVARVANFTQGTQYQLPEEKLQLLTTFTREGFLSLIRGKNYLYNVIGRGLTRPGALNASSAVEMTGLVGKLDAPHAAEYAAAIKRLNSEEPASHDMTTGQKHFWRGDYSLYYSPAYTFDVRMASTRTYRNENGNGENIKGYFLSEGAHTIAVDGNEYVDIFPAWNWTRIPGVTAPQRSSIPQPAQWGTYGTSNFAGGVSNGSQGVTVFSLNNNEYSINIAAKKAWFMFGDEIVCLGAAIKSTATEEINTTLNQCLLDGDVVASSAGTETTLAAGTHTPANVDWIYHDKVGYFFPAGGNVNVSKATASGNWSAINTSYSGAVSKNVFTLWFNHGAKPTAAGYACIIVPGKTLEEVKQYNAGNIEILVNSDSMQVVRHKSQNLWGFVFYKSATFSNTDFTLKAGSSCVLLLKDPETASVNGSLSDPSQIKQRLSLRFSSNAISGEKELTAELPKTPYAGFTVAVTIDSSTPDYVEPEPQPTPDNVLIATADTYVNGGSSTINFNSSEKLLVQYSSSTTYTRRAYLQFDPTEAIRDSGYQNVKLRLTAQATLQTGGIKNNDHKIEIRTVPANLPAIEAMTWSVNGEALAAKGETITASPVVLTHAAFVPEAVYDIDLSEYVLAHLANNSIRLMISGVADADGNIYFHSLENGNTELAPMLIFENPTPPDSSGMADVDSNDRVIVTRYYNLQGVEIEQPDRIARVYVVKRFHESGKTTTTKQIILRK